jgi:hypothetical protein
VTAFAVVETIECVVTSGNGMKERFGDGV